MITFLHDFFDVGKQIIAILAIIGVVFLLKNISSERDE